MLLSTAVTMWHAMPKSFPVFGNFTRQNDSHWHAILWLLEILAKVLVLGKCIQPTLSLWFRHVIAHFCFIPIKTIFSHELSLKSQ